MVNGADAGVIADGLPAEIKTAGSPAFRRGYFDRLAGHAVLQRLAGGPDFRGMGVSFARHGRPVMADADRVYGAPKLGNLPSLFPSMAKWMGGSSCWLQSAPPRTGSVPSTPHAHTRPSVFLCTWFMIMCCTGATQVDGDRAPSRSRQAYERQEPAWGGHPEWPGDRRVLSSCWQSGTPA